MLHLAALLDVPLYVVVGLMESLWHWTAQYAPQGDVGRWPDEVIAKGLDWPPEDAGRLIGFLVEAGWLDRHEELRLITHDWVEHADDEVHRYLARKGLIFADGRVPSLTRLSQEERTAFWSTLRENGFEVRNGVAVQRKGPKSATRKNTQTLTSKQVRVEGAKGGPKGDQRGTKGTPTGPLPMPLPLPLPLIKQPIDNGDNLNTQDARAREAVLITKVLHDSLAMGGLTPNQFLDRLMVVGSERFSPPGPWRAWWNHVLWQCADNDELLGVIADAVAYAQDCADPKKRKSKDLGELRDPGRLILKQVCAAMKKEKIRWPKFPS